jgi:hypothetical protein
LKHISGEFEYLYYLPVDTKKIAFSDHTYVAFLDMYAKRPSLHHLAEQSRVFRRTAFVYET